MKKIMVCILSYKEHQKIIRGIGDYIGLASRFDVILSLNFSGMEGETALIERILTAIAAADWPIKVYIRGVPEGVISVSCEEEAIGAIRRLNEIFVENEGGHYPWSISFKEQISSNAPKFHEYVWYLGAGDIPNSNAIDLAILLANSSDSPGVISFEILHSLVNQDSYISPVLLPRRLEAISASVYKREVISNAREFGDIWPHVEAAIKAFSLGMEGHAIISSAKKGAYVYVDAGALWLDRKAEVEINRLEIFIKTASLGCLMWEFSFKSIGYDSMLLRKDRPFFDRYWSALEYAVVSA